MKNDSYVICRKACYFLVKEYIRSNYFGAFSTSEDSGNKNSSYGVVHKLGGGRGLMCCSWFVWSGEDILRGVQTMVLFSFVRASVICDRGLAWTAWDIYYSTEYSGVYRMN